jgi:hypothetical protein
VFDAAGPKQSATTKEDVYGIGSRVKVERLSQYCGPAVCLCSIVSLAAGAWRVKTSM